MNFEIVIWFFIKYLIFNVPIPYKDLIRLGGT